MSEYSISNANQFPLTTQFYAQGLSRTTAGRDMSGALLEESGRVQQLSQAQVSELQGYYNTTLNSIDSLRHPSLPDLQSCHGRGAQLQSSHKGSVTGTSETGMKPVKASALEEEKTMELSLSGKDPRAVVDNMQNIVNRTREPFTTDFIQNYKQEHRGNAPTEELVNREYNEALLKAFTNAHYGFDNLAGVDPEKIHPSFKDPRVARMFSSFPGKMDIKGENGAEVKGVNINHLLSGVQWEATSSDSVTSAFQKRTVGYGVNSHLAEGLKPTGIFGDVHKKGEEQGHSGIYAAESGELQHEFLKSPVEGLRKFLNDPNRYVDEGKSNNVLSLLF